MTVIDSSAVVDYLLGEAVAGEVEALMTVEGELAAPDALVFEVLAVLRRETFRGNISVARAAGAVHDLGDLPIELSPSLPARERVWELRQNLTVADALFVALAEELGEPLATKDGGLAAAAAAHGTAEVTRLGHGR
ncbi:MAG: type II toxin-antitoxin system VapC family toxin [Thermoleophilaceae bacterium]